MSFDQHLRPAFDHLTTRLRRDVERHVDAAVQELVEQAEKLKLSTEEERLAALAVAVDAARADAEQAAATRHQAVVADLEQQHRQALEYAEGRLHQVTQEHHATLERTLGEHRSTLERTLGEHRSLLDRTTTEHRNTLSDTEARHQQTLAETQARTISSLQAADLASGLRLAEAFRAIDKAQALSDILNILADAVAAEAPRSAIFLAGSGQVKSWRAQGFEGQPAIEVPMADAGMIAVALDSREAVSSGGDGGDDMGAKAPAFAALTDDRGAIAVPMLVSDEVVAVVYADQGPSGDLDRASWASIVEVLARHASRSLEAITAHRLAKTLGSGATRPRTVSKPADVVVRPVPPVEEPVVKPVEPVIDEASVAAQRFAQSLIADIRAAHEGDVQAGVYNRDLMTRLGGPISQAWAQYEARVPESIRAATNYFHAEMVRTLANGDASLLTPQNP